MQRYKKGLKILYSGPYSVQYGLHLIFNADFERWLKETNSFISFVGHCAISHAEDSCLLSRLISPSHHFLGFVSDERYFLELDSVDIALSLQSPCRLRTNYPSKFFEYSRHKIVCISSIDMCLPDHLNSLYPKMPSYSTAALIYALEQVRCNLKDWKANALQLSKDLHETYHFHKIGLELDSFMVRE